MFILALTDARVPIGKNRNAFANSSALFCSHVGGVGVGGLVVVLFGIVVDLGDLVVGDVGFLDG